METASTNPAVPKVSDKEELKLDQEDSLKIPESQALQGRRKEEQVRATINQKLVETGERERLEEYLRTSLIECGWRDELKQYCKGEPSLGCKEPFEETHSMR